MSTSKIILLQKAVSLITTDKAFRNRWTLGTLIQQAVEVRYKFEDITLSTNCISRAISSVETNIDDLSYRHLSGTYKGFNSNRSYFYFQNGDLPPPSFPPPRDKEVWRVIHDIDDSQLKDYINRVGISQTRQRGNKKGDWTK